MVLKLLSIIPTKFLGLTLEYSHLPHAIKLWALGILPAYAERAHQYGTPMKWNRCLNSAKRRETLCAQIMVEALVSGTLNIVLHHDLGWQMYTTPKETNNQHQTVTGHLN